jgi:diamine N-acetyltransferase
MPVRLATTDDAAQLAEIAAQTFALACPPDTTQEAIDDFIATSLSAERFAEYLADDDRILLISHNDGGASGYVMLVLGEPDDDDVQASIRIHPTSELSKLYVLESAHGDGTSHALAEAAFDAASAAGAQGMWLGTNEQNARAIRFYEKKGFVRVGNKRFRLGDRWEDDYVFERAV